MKSQRKIYGYVLALLFVSIQHSAAEIGLGLSMYGQPKYKAGFSHFDYVNPEAAKGGKIRLPVLGKFDSLQPFLIKGVSAAGLGMVYQSLMERADDEPFSLYPSVAKSYEMGPDRK